MILVDIGNTNSHFGIAKNNRIIDSFRIHNKKINKQHLERILRRYPRDELIICSVAPAVTKIFRSIKRKKYIVGKDLIVPIKSFYNPKEIGQDRLINTLAAKTLYPDARIIIDFGTAITIDFVSKKGEYLGGFILPGINLYLRSLSQCALLPNTIKLIDSRSLIPKNTQSSISKGVKVGFSLMINTLIKEYKNRIFGKYRKTGIIVTGGESPILKKTLQFPYLYDPLLTLKGLLFMKKPPEK